MHTELLSPGSEVDLDLGNYERYLALTLAGDNNITTGKIYQHVGTSLSSLISLSLIILLGHPKGAPRRLPWKDCPDVCVSGDHANFSLPLSRPSHVVLGPVPLSPSSPDFGRADVPSVPHVTNAIRDWIKRVSKIPVDGSDVEPDVCIIELGGTVGDIESMPFIEALTQLRHEAGSMNFMNIHVSYVPTIHGEQKTKPTQHAVKSVRSYGLIPDLVACRCEQPLAASTIAKLALHCQVEVDQILVVRDMPTVYQVPLLLEEQGLMTLLQSRLNFNATTLAPADVARGAELWDTWKAVVTQQHEATINIALVGKYIETHDAYASVVKSLEHSSMHLRRKLNLIWVDAEHLEPKTKSTEEDKYNEAWQAVRTASGVIVPGGFGHRGTEGMMLASKFARENSTPFLGVRHCQNPFVVGFESLTCPLGLPGFPNRRHSVRTRYV